MKTMRQRILEFIRSQRAVSIQDLTQAFRMTEQNVRYHVSILKNEGLIEELDNPNPKQRGRPGKIYGLTLHSLGENLGLLASALLELLPPYSDEEHVRLIYDRLAGRLAEQMTASLDKNHAATSLPKHLTQRLNRLTMILNEHHYASRWEARADSPRVVLGHCPYAAIIDEHPEICHLDAGTITRLLGQPVQQTARLAKDKNGLPYCSFRVLKDGV